MSKALRGVKGSEAYIDDILTHTKDNGDLSLHGREALLREHQAALKEMFGKLSSERLF